MKPSRLAITVTAGLVIACGSDQLVGPRHETGYLDLRLTAPEAQSGALLVLLEGGVIDSVTSPVLGLAMLETGSGEYGVLVRGELRDGAVLRLWVPDRTLPYTATIAQATAGYQRSDASGYGFSYSPGR